MVRWVREDGVHGVHFVGFVVRAERNREFEISLETGSESEIGMIGNTTVCKDIYARPAPYTSTKIISSQRRIITITSPVHCSRRAHS